MAHRAAGQSAFLGKLLPATLGIAAGLPWAQQPASAPPSFDVASVKALDQSWSEISPTRSGGRIQWSTNLLDLIGYAYRMEPFRILGPVPGRESVYRFDATTAATAGNDQVRAMFQSLLVDRFRMVAHRETRSADGFGLSVGKGGLKIREAKAGDPPAPLPEWLEVDPAEIDGKVITTSPGPGIFTIAGRRVSMAQFGAALQRMLGMAVWDETGLKGNYYFAFRFARENAPAETDDVAVSTAIRETLGLRLEKHRGPVEMLVVDRIERKPTEN